MLTFNYSFFCFRFIASLTRFSVCHKEFFAGLFLLLFRKRVEFLLLLAFIWLFFLIARSTSLDRLFRYLPIKSLGTDKRISLLFHCVCLVYFHKNSISHVIECVHISVGSYKASGGTLQFDFFVRLNGPFPFNCCSVSLFSLNGVAFDLIRSSGGNRMNVLTMLTTASTLKIVLLLN